MVDLSRRHFIKILGIGSLAFAPGCTSRPEKNLFSYVQAPEDMVTGKATWYASTCRECPAGCGILAKNKEGRVIKVEGNPLHPINQGKLCMRGQAGVQGVYNPDRIRRPLLKKKDGWQALSFQEAEVLLKQKIDEAVQKGENRVHLLTEVVGRSLTTLFENALREWSSPPPLVFEPFAYESLKTANQKVFGVEGSLHTEWRKPIFCSPLARISWRHGSLLWSMAGSSKRCMPLTTARKVFLFT